MTRRRAFTIAAQGLGGIAGAAIVLPAVGFAVAPIFHRGKERWEAVGPVGDFVEDTYRQVVFTETEGIGDAGKTTAYVRKSSKSSKKNPASSSPSPTAAPTSAARSASSRPPATSSAPATAASTTSRASGSAARRCARSTSSRPGSATARSRSARATASPPSWNRSAPATPASSPAGSGNTSTRRGPLPSRALMPKLPKIPDSIVPAPLRKPAKPGEGGVAKGQAPADLKTSPPERETHVQNLGDQAKEAPVDVLAWVDQRTGASGFLTGMLYRKVPKGTNWFYTLGSATLFAFIVQAVTGVFLAMFYTPSATQAYASIAHINNDVPLGQLRARDAQVGLERDGDPDLPAHGPHLLLRRLQVPARAQLGDRRRAADPDDDDGLHRLPAAVRPALLLGLDRRHQHQRHRPDRRPVPERLPARRPRARGDHALALLRDPHAAGAGRDHRPDRRPHVPGGQARHDRAALGAGREAEGRRPDRPARRRRRGQRRGRPATEPSPA